MKVAGFKAAGFAGGLRYKGRNDLGLIVADEAVSAAGVFTRNRVQAHPVTWSKKVAAKGQARAILVNAGQANACCGPDGDARAEASARMTAQALGTPAEEIFLASTGVIGQPLNLEALEAAIPGLAAGLAPENLNQVAEAMMTTDTRPKMAEARGMLDGRPFVVVGLAKGSGMICPNMATMLSFVLTDAAVSSECLRKALSQGAETTFNRVTVDGDTSTNDCILAMASAKAQNPEIRDLASPSGQVFFRALEQVLGELARMIAADGEGATKFVTIKVNGARTQDEAIQAARTVANSPLVKTAFFGQDANWGRIMAALGRSEAEFDPIAVDIHVDDAPLVLQGQGVPDPALADEVMKKHEFTVLIDLKAGSARAEVWTCDFSLDYVKINADYRS